MSGIKEKVKRAVKPHWKVTFLLLLIFAYLSTCRISRVNYSDGMQAWQVFCVGVIWIPYLLLMALFFWVILKKIYRIEYPYSVILLIEICDKRLYSVCANEILGNQWCADSIPLLAVMFLKTFAIVMVLGFFRNKMKPLRDVWIALGMLLCVLAAVSAQYLI